jgi:ATP-dependent DNA helicase RecG
MKSAQQLLDELNTLDEHTAIEAKKASDIGPSIMETVCAFANEPDLGGGYLLLGVAPVADSFWPIYEVVGVPDPDQIQQVIASQCSSMFNVPIRPQIAVERIQEKLVVTVFVPEAHPHEKPIHFKTQPLPNSARRRIGSTDQRCTEDDLIVFYHERRGESFDEQAIDDATLNDIDDDAIELYRQLRQEVDAQAEELTWNNGELLESLGALKRKQDDLKPTIAGVLLFGTTKALRRLFPMMRIDYIRVPGLQWVKDPDRRFDTVEIRAPLIRAIQRARSAILDDLPKAFSLPAGEVQGKEIPLLPDRVVREVVANAVMHRDYRVHGSIQIIRYANRLEVRNPGYSIKAEERLGQPGSETRNPRIAAVLHDVKFAETKGSGIRVMRELMSERDLSMPLLQSDRTGNSFMAMLLFHHFLSNDDLDWLKSFEVHALTEAEMKAMISAREVGAIDNSTYRDINRDADTLSASKHLRRLCDCGLLEKKGSGPATFYTPTLYMMENWPPPQELTGRKPKVKSPDFARESPDVTLKPPDLDGKSPDLDGKSPDLDGKSPDLPASIREKIDAMGRKSKGDDALDVVLSLLKWRELTLTQLAGYLGRTEDHVRKQYLNPLLNADIVRRTNPDKINDPNQAYRAVLVPKPKDNL